MTSDELADALATNLTELHAQIAELPDGSFKRKLDRLARVAHGALEQLQEEALSGDLIQPTSGGDPKIPPGGG